MARILGIETSCDETAAAVVEDGHRVIGEAVATQIEIHKKYGGVVPELASRNHVVDIVPVVEEAMTRAQVGWSEIDAIAVTQGPGLVGALLVGLQVAKALAYAHDKPLIPVHHLTGHLHAVHLHTPDAPRPEAPALPHVALAVSGGHTALYRVDGPEQVRRIANTRDDAAGEAFDKVARMLGLGYPGGPIIERLARQGDPSAHRFTPPRFKKGNPLDFSFSGLKTAVLTVIKGFNGALPEGQPLYDLIASFQAAAIDQLVDRCGRAAESEGVEGVVLAGGVACNGALRAAARAALEAKGLKLYVPPPRWCTDNAAMIASAAEGRPLGEGLAPVDQRLNALGTWQLSAARS
ncbi:tRNA (adenosine(37)-N6)-threonylcarbamoyltransferase complex transferase subunit TsaD [Myxococcota bacterium]|nr:tRNA (adenosine(37)-N6)-threonylcarbamoyltransferase complex transferase subunit TsaD [Myxococcota bacterium]MBU1432351.1 tRNA (adenosine(37)-N6)-threonylcarbamoyltransferase complex transferase subunit TsaD [Myxococcota bacterium]MBU1896380.1 tRNA (adenosine(37)-N6)-threonylcarbamoyltransferase complex transferase subunit TsaD [Myxococcota bacterium]